MKPKMVVDASVALKWIPGPKEEKVKEARKIYQKIADRKIEGWAPSFLALEILNILIRKRKANPELAVKGVETVLQKLKIKDLNVEKLPQWKELMKKYGVSGYDSLYLQLADELGCKVLSCDKKLTYIQSLVTEL